MRRIPFGDFFKESSNDQTEEGAEGVYGCDASVPMCEGKDGQVGEPDESGVEESCKWIQDKGGNEVIFAVYPLADLLVPAVQLSQ